MFVAHQGGRDRGALTLGASERATRKEFGVPHVHGKHRSAKDGQQGHSNLRTDPGDRSGDICCSPGSLPGGAPNDESGTAAGVARAARPQGQAGPPAAVPFTCSIGKSTGDDTEGAIAPKSLQDKEEEGQKCEEIGERFGAQLRAARCKCGGCHRCGGAKAFKLSEKLLSKLQTMPNPMMWTLTVDPQIGDPLKVYKYVKEKGAIKELVRSLYERGYLRSREYFCADEPQTGKRRKDGGQGTGQMHYHVILDCKPEGIPKHVVQERWDKFRPSWAPPASRSYWLMGKVQFEKIDCREGIAKYVCKYVAKGAKEGILPWLLEWLDAEPGRHHRPAHWSKGFFGPSKPKLAPTGPRKPRKKRTYSERLQSCFEGAALFWVQPAVAADGEIKRRYSYLAQLRETWLQVCERLNLGVESFHAGYCWLRADEYAILLGDTKSTTSDITSRGGTSCDQGRKGQNGVSGAFGAGIGAVSRRRGGEVAAESKLVDRGFGAEMEATVGGPAVAEGSLHVQAKGEGVKYGGENQPALHDLWVSVGAGKGDARAHGGRAQDAVTEGVFGGWVGNSTGEEVRGGGAPNRSGAATTSEKGRLSATFGAAVASPSPSGGRATDGAEGARAATFGESGAELSFNEER